MANPDGSVIIDTMISKIKPNVRVYAPQQLFLYKVIVHLWPIVKF